MIRKSQGILACFTLAALCSACVYRINIQQGNYLDQQAVDQVKSGMTRSQVRYLLGTPMVADSFNKERWDYIYYLKKGRTRHIDSRRVTVYFDGTCNLCNRFIDFLIRRDRSRRLRYAPLQGQAFAALRSASTPWVALPVASWLTLVRHDPNAIRSGFPGFRVAITLAGYVVPSPSAGGQTCSPSICTVYGVMVPGSSPSAIRR